MGAFKTLEIIEAGIQSDLLTENTSPVYVPFVEGFAMKLNADMVENRLANDNGGNQEGIVGTLQYDVTGEVQVFAEADSGSPVAPVVDPFLKACGFSAATATTIVYSPCFEADYSAVSMYGYSGSKTTGDSMCYKAKNMMFEGSLVGKVKTPLALKLTGSGVVSAVPTPGNYPSVTLLNDAITPLTMSTTTINGISYNIAEFEIIFGYKLKMITNGAGYGFLRAQLVPHAAKWTAKVLMEEIATKDPFTKMIGVDNSAFSIVTGSGSSVVSIASSTSQIMGVDESDDDGMKMYDLSGQFTNNNYTITFDGSGS